MNSEEKAYLAGIIDGEGTVTLTRQHRNEAPSPKVSVANCNLDLLKWIKTKVGAGSVIKKKKAKEKHSQSYAWSINDDRALRFLETIKEYLLIKKPHAELVLKDYKAVTKRNGRYTPQELAKKMELVAKVRKLNQR